MRRAVALILLCLLPALTLSGCWSYKSLNDISIVMGFGVDKDPVTGDYSMSTEVVDLTKGVKEGSPAAKLIESRGRTIFGAVREAKRKLLNRLYFGNTQIAVMGEDYARNEGLWDLMDWMLRDAEGRETVTMLVMKGGTARELLSLDGIDHSILSLEIDSIITEDNKFTSSTSYVELYKAFDVLSSPGIELTLPAFHIVENDGEKVPEVDGVAIFRGDRLVDYLTPDQTRYFLLATGKVKGGILTIAMHGAGRPDTSLEIFQNKVKMDYQVTDGRLTFSIEVEVVVLLAETKSDIDLTDINEVKALEEEAGARLKMEIEAVIKKVQAESGCDIFGFGQYIRQRDAKLWHANEDRWEEIFRALPVSVSCKVKIKNSASVRSREAAKE